MTARRQSLYRYLPWAVVPWAVVILNCATAAPGLTPIEDQVLRAGQLFSMEITADDTDGETPSLTADALPDDAVLLENPDGSRTFMWIPDTANIGDHTLVIRAVDTEDPELTREQSVKLTIASANEYQRLRQDLMYSTSGDRTKSNRNTVPQAPPLSVARADDHLLPVTRSAFQMPVPATKPEMMAASLNNTGDDSDIETTAAELPDSDSAADDSTGIDTVRPAGINPKSRTIESDILPPGANPVKPATQADDAPVNETQFQQTTETPAPPTIITDNKLIPVIGKQGVTAQPFHPAISAIHERQHCIAHPIATIQSAPVPDW